MSEPVDPLSPALQALFTRFAELFRRVAARYRLSGDDVDALLQEVRIRLWRSQPRSELIAVVGASYMYRTAVTAALTVIRRRRMRTVGASETLSEQTESSAHMTVETPEQRLAADELAAEVERAVDTLPPPRPTVVRLYLSGYSREEIAELLGWTEGKTRNLIYRGLADLRAVLSERGIGPEARR